jgi:hypothetical protein
LSPTGFVPAHACGSHGNESATRLSKSAVKAALDTWAAHVGIEGDKEGVNEGGTSHASGVI